MNQHSESQPGPARWQTLAAVAWLLVVGGVLAAMLHSAGIPGVPARPGAHWPVDSGLKRSGRLPALVVFLHPRCPCSSATLEELNRLLARTEGQVETQIVFAYPELGEPGGQPAPLLSQARSLPGVTVTMDAALRETTRFGVMTSGTVLLYGPTGRRLFDGGITIARGHAGDNDFAAALTALIRGRQTRSTTTPVFGCSLGTRNSP